MFTKAEQVSQKDLKTWLLDFLVLHYGPLLIQGIFQFHKQPPLYIHTINSRSTRLTQDYYHLFRLILAIYINALNQSHIIYSRLFSMALDHVNAILLKI